MTVKTAIGLLMRHPSKNAELAFVAMAADFANAKTIKEFKKIVKKQEGFDLAKTERLLQDDVFVNAYLQYWHAVKPHTKARHMKAVIKRFKELFPPKEQP